MERLAPELVLIQDTSVRQFVELALKAAPAYFWTVTSSTSGKNHPPDERGPGGRVLHTKRVARVVHELARMEDISQGLTDFLVGAALIHDLVVNGTEAEPMPHNWREHDVALAEFLAPIVPQGHKPLFFFMMDICAGHMGRWASKPALRPIPGTLGHLLHIADVIASRSWVRVEFAES